MTRVGLLTGGGDCPGLNAVIRAVVRRGLADGGHTFVGFRHGWAGVLRDNAHRARPAEHRRDPAPRRHDPRHLAHQPLRRRRRRHGAVRRTLEAREIDVLIPIGGEDTLGVALRLHGDGVPIVGVPKTIDNDLGGTDVTFGFQTAVQIVTDAIDRLHTTAESHDRVMVVEVMGRHAGWIATHAGIAGGADAILVPERPFDIDEVVAHLRAPPRARAQLLDRGRRRGRHAARGHAAGARRHRHRRLRPRPPRRDRRAARGRDRAPHRLRDARDDPRPRPARRHAGGLRPRARHALRGGRDRRRRRRALRRDGGAVAAPRSSRSRSARRCASRSCWTPACTRRPSCSSAERPPRCSSDVGGAGSSLRWTLRARGLGARGGQELYDSFTLAGRSVERARG